MTCIVGVQHRGSVYIGGDSAGVAGYSLTVRADSKVFRVGPYVMGFTSSFRMGQLLRYALTPPEPEIGADLEAFMATTFVDAVRKCLKDGGWLSKSSDREEGGTFLVGINGELFSIHQDFQIGRPVDGYAAVGCGDDLALGSLHTSRGRGPRWRVNAALEAAAHHSAGVSAPYVIEVAR